MINANITREELFSSGVFASGLASLVGTGLIATRPVIIA